MKTAKSNLSGILVIVVNVLLLITILLFFFLSNSCTRKYDKEEFLGSEYASAPSGFHVVNNDFTAAPSSINFVAENVTFASQFSHKVSWKITITGRSSRAKKHIEGLSDYLDTANAKWDGSSSNLRFFKAGETCDVALSFLGTELISTDTVQIILPRKYAGVLISDFDGKGLLNDPNWWYYYSDTLKPANTAEITSQGILSTPLEAIQGNKYLSQTGEDLDRDWYIGGLGYWYDANLNDKLVEMSSNPEELYLNAFVNVNGNQNTALSFAVFEGGTPRDVFSKVVQVKSSEWELVSMKLSTFTRNPTSTGDGVMEIDKIKFMEIVPAPSVQGAVCEMNVDYIIFTKGAPFRP